jgi:hypothetical protein
MSKEKERPTVGIDGNRLPELPPSRDARVWARLVRVMFYTPGFLGLLLIKAGEPASFGITIELLMLASGAAIVGGLFIGTQSSDGDVASKVGVWSGALILELLATVPFLAAVPALFHELANSTLLHEKVAGAADVALGPSELLPAVAILPFMIYQLSGFGTLHYVVSKRTNWIINVAVLALIVVGYTANRMAMYVEERMSMSALVILMGVTVYYGIAQLKRMQTDFDARRPPKPPKKQDDA